MNDGLIPRHDAGGGILSEYDREELERADAKLSPTARGDDVSAEIPSLPKSDEAVGAAVSFVCKGRCIGRGAESVVSDQ